MAKRDRNPERQAPAPVLPPQGVVATRAVVIASIIVGGAILAGGFLLKGSLDGTAARLDSIDKGLAETKQALALVASNQGAQAAADQRRKGPDPNKRYTINTKGAPRKGSATARVQLVEFSDFQ